MRDFNSQFSVLLLTGLCFPACNHPSLVSQDYRKDKEAVESKAAKNDQDIDDGADDLADLIGGLGLTAATKRCQMCQCVYVDPTFSPRRFL